MIFLLVTGYNIPSESVLPGILHNLNVRYDVQLDSRLLHD